MKCDRKELSKLLNISLNAIKLIEKRNTLKQRLNKAGYLLTDKYKERNKYIYVINKSSQNLKQMINKMYGINKTNEFIKYFNLRTTEQPKTIQEIAIVLGITEKTVIKWDAILQDKQILSKDGFYYFKLDKNNNEIIEIDRYEYKSFWKNKKYLNAFSELRRKYIEGQISLTELQLTSGDVAVIISLIENIYCFKIKKYKVNRNQIYAETVKLINEYQKGVILEV